MANYVSIHTGKEIDNVISIVTDSNVTQDQLTYLSGLRANVQTQLDAVKDVYTAVYEETTGAEILEALNDKREVIIRYTNDVYRITY